MARLPVFKRIRREDLPNADPWVDKLLYPINQFMEAVSGALNKSLIVPDNVTGQWKESTFTTLAAYDGTAANFEAIEWTHSLSNRPKACLLTQIYVIGGAAYAPIEGDVCVDWIERNGVITVGLIRGLAASTKYFVRFLLL